MKTNVTKQTIGSLFLGAMLLAAPGARGGAEVVATKVDETVKEALDTARVPYKNDAEGNFLLHLKFKNGRAQNIVIHSKVVQLGTEDDGDDLREIYSVAFVSDSPPSAELASRLLMENGSMKIGGWVVRKNGARYEVGFRAMVPAEICEDALLPSSEFVATHADALENALTGKDEK